MAHSLISSSRSIDIEKKYEKRESKTSRDIPFLIGCLKIDLFVGFLKWHAKSKPLIKYLSTDNAKFLLFKNCSINYPDGCIVIDTLKHPTSLL